jgi:hypothetical protein
LVDTETVARTNPALVAENGKRMASEKSAADFDDDLAWFLTCGDAAMGKRGTLGGIVSALEHGGHPGGVPNTDLYTDQQVGWGKSVYGDVEKHRWLERAWLALSDESKATLAARYTAPRARFRGDEGYGARDRYVEGSDHSVTTGRGTRAGTILLGDLAGLAFALTDKPEQLFLACVEPSPIKLDAKGNATINRELEKGRRQLRNKTLKAAETASAVAHAEWAESKAGADPMRRRAERRAVLVSTFGRLEPWLPAEDVA